MKVDKKFFICAMLVLMLFLCINASSAVEPLNETLGASIADEQAIDNVSMESLGMSENTFGVDENGEGQYRSISGAVSLAGGEETIPIENEKYALNKVCSLEKEIPNLYGASEGTIYVSETGNDENDGLSETTAIASLSHAVEIASLRDGKNATVYVLNGYYITGPIDDNNMSLTIIGQEKGKVTIHGTGDYIFKVNNPKLDWKFENLDFEDISSTATRSVGTLLLWDNSNYTIKNCNFRNIKAKYGIDISAEGNVVVRNVLMENINAVTPSSATFLIYGGGNYDIDNLTIRNCGLDGGYAEVNSANTYRTLFYINDDGATVTLTNSKIIDNNGPMMSAVESRSKLTIVNTTIANNIVNTSYNGNNGGDNLITANNDNSNINISNCVITNNTIVKSGKGLFYNYKGSINAEYSDISCNKFDKIVGSTGTIIADNNWWGTNNQLDTKVDKWVIMNVEMNDSNLSENNRINFTIDFNHVKTSSGDIEELVGGKIPKNSYKVVLSAKNGEITPDNVEIKNGEVIEQTFTVTEINDVITLSCDGGDVEIIIEGFAPYRGIIYVNKTGSNDNEGSIDAPVLTIDKAIELACTGSGQIIIDEGSYTGYGYHITNDLSIIGMGNVVIDAEGEGQLFYTGYTTAINKISLTNLTLAGASSDYGQAINSYANELVLDNVTLTNNPGDGSLIIANGKLTMNNCIVANHNGGDVISAGSKDVIINNTLFENNNVADSNGILYSSSSSNSNRNVIIENTAFKRNIAKLGILYLNGVVNVKNSSFIENTNLISNGGAIREFDDLTVTNSTFIDNKAGRDSGAIHVGYNRKATITHSTFINNTAGTGYHGDAIASSGKLTVNYCVLISYAGNYIIYSSSEDVANVQYNWWGTNDNPKSLNGVGTYLDDYDEEVYSEIDASNWVYMNVSSNVPANPIAIGNQVEITVDFTNYMDSTKILKTLPEIIPEVNVSAKAIGDLDNEEAITSSGIAKFVYTATTAGEDTINITSADTLVQIPLTVESTKSVIYVDLANGANTNDGKTRETAVKTIEKAVEIADGEIIVLAGEYTVNSLLNITKDLKIIGEGDVTVKSNSQYSIEVYDEWEDEWVSENHYTLIENNANLEISNIKFTLVRASMYDEFIQNNGNLLINTSQFSNIKITSSRGVIQNIKGAKLEVDGTTFRSASGTYGAINNNGELLVNNSKFLDADRSSDSGVYSTAITSYNKATIINSEFKNNRGTAGGAVYVMYSYTNLAYPVMEIYNCTFEGNQASGTSYSDGSGAAVRCSGNQITLTITNSTFKNNNAKKGGAVFADGTVNIDQCVFNGDTASMGEAIYVDRGSTIVQNSVILDGTSSVWTTSATVTVNDNWWGTNDKPNDYADTWVKMDASISPANVQAGDEVTVTAKLDNDKLPNGVIEVTFTSTSGKLNETVTFNNSQASATYTIDENDESINVTSGNAEIVLPIEAPVPSGAIYVSPKGNDVNDGLTEANAVATIAHAIEIAQIGKIILLEGTHTINSTLMPTKDLDITGQGVAIVDGNNTRIIQTSAALNLTNIEFTNGYSESSNLINIASGGTILSLNNVKFYGNIAKQGVVAQTGTKLIINNSKFYDNDFTTASNSNGLVYINSADAIIVNSEFRGNKGESASAIGVNRAGSASTVSLVMNNVTIANNFANFGNGIVSVTGTNTAVEITNSTFINNWVNASDLHVGGYGGAIYMAANQGMLTVNQSVFINNTGNNPNSLDTGIYANKGTVNIVNSILLGNDTTMERSVVNDGADVTAENNWWGNNEKANTNVDVLKIVTMAATLTPEDAQVGDAVTINITFDNENLPKDIITVTVTSSSGSLDEIITVNGAQSSVNYSGDIDDSYISVVSSQAEVILPFDENAGVIFVLPGADNTNPGTRDAPVGTIARALELATKGKIVLLEGTHNTDDLGTIISDLSITGEGKVIIDAQNNNRILYVGENAKVTIVNVTMINGYTSEDSGALLGNGNELTLINCTLANSSTGPMNNGGAIYSAGKLTIINTIIANCSAREGGAIFTQDPLVKETTIKLVNSTLENNYASGNENLGGGAIFAQQISEFTIENTSFVKNEAGSTSSGGAIYISHSDTDVKITDSKFIENHANGQDQVGGGAIYRAPTSNYQKEGTMTITGSLFENNTCDANGGAIYARATTVNIANSVLVNNKDANGLAIYGYKTSTVTPTIILNDNWWGSNNNPSDLIGGSNGYKPTLSRWAILTITNDTAIVAGETVKLTVSINNYTTGSTNGTLSKPITVKRNQVIETTSGDIKGVLENGEFTYYYTVPANLKYIAATVDGETQVLYVIASSVKVEIDDISVKRYEKVHFEINVTSEDIVDTGVIELYVNGEKLIATIEVHDGKAIGDVVISEVDGKYNLTAKYIDVSQFFNENESNATLTVSGTCELVNETFFNFFDGEGILRDEISEDELIFKGNFSGLGVNTIIIPRSISIKGDDAILYDMSISLQDGDTKISDMKFIADSVDFIMSEYAVILAAGENIEVNNVSINYTAPSDATAYAILAKSADNFKLMDSTIIFDANNKANLIQQAGLIIDSSNDVEIKGNVINASLPARDVAYNYYYPELSGIYQDLVLGVGIQGGQNIDFTDNEINVNAKSAESTFATIDSFAADDVKDLLISGNNFTQTDFTGEGKAGYANVLDLYKFEGVTVQNNNILVNTTTGKERAGTAYPIQATGPYACLVIDNNNLTSISKGPALGIYSQNYDGVTDILITNNNINVTGYATESEYSLVSGMELQDTNAKVYNNTIYSQSISSYGESNALYGISYAQYTSGSHTFDIKDNTIYTEGKYAVYLQNAQNSNVTGNTLYAHELAGDESVKISAGENNIVKDNLPGNDLSIIVNVDDIVVGQDAIISVTTNVNASGAATVIVGGKNYTVDVVEGFGNRSISGLDSGVYNVTVTFKSYDFDYGGIVNSTVFNVAKLNSSVNITISGTELGNDTAIAVSIPGVTGNVTVIVNGKPQTIPLDESGNATYIIENIAAGDYDVVVIYSGDKNHEFAYAADSFTVDKLSSKIDVNVSSGKSGEDVNVTVFVVNATGIVSVFVDGVESSIPLDENGTAVFTIPAVGVGDHSVVVVYPGDDTHDSAIASANFTAVKEAAEVNVTVPSDVKAGEEANVTVSIPGASGNVSVIVDGVESSIPLDENGTATYIIPAVGAGDHSVVVVYPGDDTYDTVIVSDAFTAVKEAAEVNVTVPSDVKAGEIADVIISIPGASGIVSVFVDGVESSIPLDENGTATYIIPVVGAGDHSVVVVYPGDDTHDSAVDSANFTAVKEAAEVNVTVPGDVKAGGIADVIISIPGASGNVSVIVDGVEEVVRLDETGAVTYSIVPVGAGDHSVVVVYSGDDTHGSAVASANFTVVKEVVEANITVPSEVKAGEEVNVTVSIPGATGNVSVIVDGVENVVPLDENGTATYTIPAVAAGDHSVVVVYPGDDTHDTLVVSDAFTVVKEAVEANITVPGDVKAGEEVNVTVSIPGATGNVSVIVDGVGNVVPLDENGTAVYTIPVVAAGDHSVVVVYPGDDTHDTLVVSDAFTADKETTEANVTIGEITPEGANVTVSIPGATGNVSVIVDGVENVVPLDENGTATYTIPEVAGGEHSVVVVYDGDDTHAGTHAAKTLYNEEFPTRFTNITVADGKLTAILVLPSGDGLANAPVSIAINGEVVKATTDANGVLTVEDVSGKVIELKYEGNNTILPTDVSIDLTGTSPARDSTAFVSSDFEQYACDFYEGERGGNFTFKLTDSQGNPLENKTVFIGYNGVTYNRTTDKNGFATVQINLKNAGLYTFVIVFLGDENYNASMAVHKININKKPITITAAAKSYKATAKTKKYTVTLKTTKGSSVDGKTYLAKGKKVSLKINGKTYTAKTNAKGQATFSLKITKKGKFATSIKFDGDNTYNKASKKVKITIK